ATTPYAVWTEVMREFMNFGRDDPEDVVEERLRAEISSRTPELTRWMPLVAIAFGLEVAPTPEIEMLDEKNRRPKLHEVVGDFLEAMMPEATLIVMENVHHMDPASSELLSYVATKAGDRPWLFGVARRSSDGGFKAPKGSINIELEALTPKDA